MHAQHAAETMQPAQCPQTTLESAVSGVSTAASELDAAIGRLSGRLQSVMAPSVPQPVGQTTNRSLNAVDVPHRPAVNDLSVLRTHLEAQTATVNELASRLET